MNYSTLIIDGYNALEALALPKKRNMPSRERPRPGHMICTRQGSTWYGQTVTRTDASRIPISAQMNIRRRGKLRREVKICGAV